MDVGLRKSKKRINNKCNLFIQKMDKKLNSLGSMNQIHKSWDNNNISKVFNQKPFEISDSNHLRQEQNCKFSSQSFFDVCSNHSDNDCNICDKNNFSLDSSECQHHNRFFSKEHSQSIPFSFHNFSKKNHSHYKDNTNNMIISNEFINVKNNHNTQIFFTKTHINLMNSHKEEIFKLYNKHKNVRNQMKFSLIAYV